MAGKSTSVRARIPFALAAVLLFNYITVACTAPAPREHISATPSPSPTLSKAEPRVGRSTDRGVLHIAAGFRPNEISFWDLSDGLIAGSRFCRACPVAREGIIAATDDAGRSWHVVYRGDRSLDGVTTVGTQDAWVTGPRSVVATTDAGRTWQVVSHESLALPSFSSATYGWAAVVAKNSDSNLSVAETTDGGRTWTRIPTPCRRAVTGLPASPLTAVPLYLADLSNAGPGAGWVTCSGGGTMGAVVQGVYQTFDHGWTWTQRWGAYAGPAAMQMLPDGRGALWSTGAGPVFEGTTDAGQGWHRLGGSKSDVLGEQVVAAWLVSDTTWYALVTTRGPVSLVRSHDGGRHWRVVRQDALSPCGLAQVKIDPPTGDLGAFTGDTIEVGSQAHLVRGPACRFEVTGTMTMTTMGGALVPMRGNPTTVKVSERLTPERPTGGIMFGWFDPCVSPVVLSLRIGATRLTGTARETDCAYPSARSRLQVTPAAANEKGYREVAVGKS